METEKLKELSLKARTLILKVAHSSKAPHVACCLSCIDLLVALYFYKMRIQKNKWQERDIFILSKAHAALALYVVLTLKGLMKKTDLYRYYQNNGSLPAHLDRFSHPAIEVSSGALGHGFNIALGMAYGYKLKGDKRKVYTLIGDGENEEGSIWEGALFASKLKIDNLTAILDYNNLQGYGSPTQICSFEPIPKKWQNFGWQVYKTCGHDFKQIIQTLDKPSYGKPKIIIAKTIKGKGVSFMENNLKWHYYAVDKDTLKKALLELNSQKE